MQSIAKVGVGVLFVVYSVDLAVRSRADETRQAGIIEPIRPLWPLWQTRVELPWSGLWFPNFQLSDWLLSDTPLINILRISLQILNHMAASIACSCRRATSGNDVMSHTLITARRSAIRETFLQSFCRLIPSLLPTGMQGLSAAIEVLPRRLFSIQCRNSATPTFEKLAGHWGSVIYFMREDNLLPNYDTLIPWSRTSQYSGTSREASKVWRFNASTIQLQLPVVKHKTWQVAAHMKRASQVAAVSIITDIGPWLRILLPGCRRLVPPNEAVLVV